MNFAVKLDEALGVERPEKQRISPGDKELISLVHRRLLKGKGMVRKALRRGHVSIGDIINAIRTKRCVSLPDRDIGYTYLSSAIGAAIRDVLHGENINKARILFGMKTIDIGQEYRRKIQKRREQAVRAKPKE